jgi:hypothetical protein
VDCCTPLKNQMRRESVCTATASSTNPLLLLDLNRYDCCTWRRLAVEILDSSEHIAELQLARDGAETEYLLHTITDEALRLAHGGKKALRIREKHLATLPDGHDQLKSDIDQYIYYKSLLRRILV